MMLKDTNQIKERAERDVNYRKLVVLVVLSLPHRPGILEFVDCVDRVEAGDRQREKKKEISGRVN